MAMIKRLVSRTLTASSLIAHLEHFDEETPIFISCSYGDRCNTMQILPIQDTGDFDIEDLETSGYSQSGVALKDEDDRQKRGQGSGDIIILFAE